MNSAKISSARCVVWLVSTETPVTPPNISRAVGASLLTAGANRIMSVKAPIRERAQSRLRDELFLSA